MRIEVWAVGKLKKQELSSSIEHYLKRMKKYHPVRVEEITVRVKSTDPEYLRRTEGEKILSRLSSGDCLVLMDEKGQQLNSRKFAGFLQKIMMESASRVIFLIGGAHGFDELVYDRAQYKISMSNWTFPHDLARLILIEQLYRGFSILHNSPYHH